MLSRHPKTLAFLCTVLHTASLRLSAAPPVSQGDAAPQAHVVDVGTRSVKHGTQFGAAAFTGDLNDQDKSKREVTVSLPVDAALTRNAESRPYVVIAFGF